MPKGITLTREQQATRRDEIVDIALRLIAENGFQSPVYTIFSEQKTRLLYMQWRKNLKKS